MACGSGGLTCAGGGPLARPHPREHGTMRGAGQHRYRGEPECDPCAAGRREFQKTSNKRARAAARLRPRPRVAVCGTTGGYQKHLKDRTSPCFPCRVAHANYEHERKYGVPNASHDLSLRQAAG